MGVDGPIIPRLVAGQRGGGALKPGCDCTGRSARRSSAPGATAFPVSRHGAEHGQHAGGGSVHHHPAAHVGPRRSAVVAGLCHDPSPHDCDGLGSLGARCSGVLVLGSGGRAWAISSFGSADSLDFNSGPGKENGEPPLGRLPVNRTRAV